MRLCSDYINKIEALRKKVNNKVKTRQYAELYDMTRPKGDKEELEVFYANFDSAFLHLFPISSSRSTPCCALRSA